MTQLEGIISSKFRITGHHDIILFFYIYTHANTMSVMGDDRQGEIVRVDLLPRQRQSSV